MVSHELGVGCYVGWREVIQLKSLSLDPTKRLEVLQQEVVARHLGRELNAVVRTTLWYPDDGLDLLDLLVIRWRDTV